MNEEQPEDHWHPTKDEITDVVGKNVESLLALLIGLTAKMNNFSVANEMMVGNDKYRYQLVLGREGSRFYDMMEEEFREAGLLGEK